MQLLVTGGAGYVGSVVTKLLLEAGHQVTVLDDLSTGYESSVPAGAMFVKGSVQDAAAGILAGGQFDGVLHFAGFIQVGESVVEPERYWANNVGGTMALLDAMQTSGVRRLIFSSTGTVHGDAGRDPIPETAPIAPLNPYAASKAAVDLMLPGYSAAHGLAATSLRYFNASGALLHSDGTSYGERHDPESHLIPIILQAAAGERDYVPLYGDDYDTPDGTCIRDYVHVADLATAHLLALQTTPPGQHRVYNLGSGRGFSNLQVIQAVSEVVGQPVPFQVKARRPGDIVTQTASSMRAHAELGWQPTRTDLHAIVADAWAFRQTVPLRKGREH